MDWEKLKREEKDVGHGRWVRGHGPGCSEDPETGEAERGGEEENPRAQEQVRFFQRPDRSPSVRLRHLRGPFFLSLGFSISLFAQSLRFHQSRVYCSSFCFRFRERRFEM